MDTDSQTPAAPLTLAIDIGGSNLKAGVLAATGSMIAGPTRIPTPAMPTPEAVLDALVGLAGSLGTFDRVSVGFPGVVRTGLVLTAPNLHSQAWHGFPLAVRLAERLDKPVRMLNDGSVQGPGVVSGHGLECVITLGTGVGFALFQDGRLMPHLEIGQHPIRSDKTYDQYIGAVGMRAAGRKRWNKRVRRAIDVLATLVNYDRLFIGGGNAKYIAFDLPPGVQIVSNQAGISGGVRLWDARLDEAFAYQTTAVRTALEHA